FPRLAEDAVALAELPLKQRPAPGVAEPRIDLLQVHGPAGQVRIGRVHDPDARNLDRQPRDVAGHVDRMVERAAGPFGLLRPEPEGVAKDGRSRYPRDE